MTDTGWINLNLNSAAIEATDGRNNGFRYRVINENHVYVQAGFGFHYNYRSQFNINASQMPINYMPSNRAFIYVACDDNPSSSFALTSPSTTNDDEYPSLMDGLLGATAGRCRDLALVSCIPENGQWVVIKSHNTATHKEVTTAGYAWVDFQIDYFID